mmetsp:Transcript_13794/g.21848  ORF Transcript_13794/g.21848 Transcript_13794/m.21848 type:complete len:86 (-) Transcript_13794:1465-1722(-)
MKACVTVEGSIVLEKDLLRSDVLPASSTLRKQYFFSSEMSNAAVTPAKQPVVVDEGLLGLPEKLCDLPADGTTELFERKRDETVI